MMVMMVMMVDVGGSIGTQPAQPSTIQCLGASDLELGVFIFPPKKYGEPVGATYIEFPNHLIVNDGDTRIQ